MRDLEAAFAEGRLAVAQAVAVDNNSGSHFECQDQMEQGADGGERAASGGWLGRALRLGAGGAVSPLAAVAVGKALPESLRGAPAASVLESLEDMTLRLGEKERPAVTGALERLYGADVSLLGERGGDTLELFRRVAALQGLAAEGPANDAEYPDEEFGRGMRLIASLIRAEVGLRVATIDLGGWDTRFFQGGASGLQAGRIRALTRV
jgi:uncharacterized protein (DUF1501 family)